ncbi:hypothetical protein KQX54_017483 [Cotesia glomerata]|uniref:Uncharacterized protein n=1 Tax=Cotesia glomerata TaxID=32391 RepID=A0AAV7IRG6_COTGL|nr:hypothetical protein KQX54_017483 [Cotesia glomerata]
MIKTIIVTKQINIFLSTQGLAEKWKYLSYKAEEAQRSSTLQREMATMHLELRAVHERLISHEIVLEPAYLIEDNINQITLGLPHRHAGLEFEAVVLYTEFESIDWLLIGN